jgi:two-component system phosphate regulon response regulator PhoB
MPKSILVIEDEADVSRYFKTLFEDNGYSVRTARDGVEAMESLRAEAPDLVTLDINLPNKSGVRVYREMKQDEKLKSIPVLMVTGTLPEFKDFISKRRQVPPPDGYLEKPVALGDLLAEAARLLGQGPLGIDPALRRGLPWSMGVASRPLRS